MACKNNTNNIQLDFKGPIQFENWQTDLKPSDLKQKLTLHFKPNEQDEPAFCAVIVTGPRTDRFQIDGPVELASPLMPLLDVAERSSVQYEISFIPPSTTERNFQDRIVFHSRTSEIIVPVFALQEGAGGISPPDLPPVKRPSSRIFKLVEQEVKKEPEKSQTKQREAPHKTASVNTKLDAVNVIRSLRAKRSTEISLTGESKSCDIKTFNSLVQKQHHISNTVKNNKTESEFYQSILRGGASPAKLIKQQQSPEATTILAQGAVNDDSSEEEQYEAAGPDEIIMISPETNEFKNSERDFSSSEEDDDDERNKVVVKHTEEDYNFYKSFMKKKAEPKAPVPPVRRKLIVNRNRATKVIRATDYIIQQQKKNHDNSSSSEEEEENSYGFNDYKDDDIGCKLSDDEECSSSTIALASTIC